MWGVHIVYKYIFSIYSIYVQYIYIYILYIQYIVHIVLCCQADLERCDIDFLGNLSNKHRVTNSQAIINQIIISLSTS